MKRDVWSMIRVLVFVLAAATSATCGSSGNPHFDCAVCDVPQLNCASPVAAAVQIDTITASGCSGTITSADGTNPLWVHCDSGRVCIEHDDECFVATSTGTSFSVALPPDKGTLVCSVP